MTKYLDLDGLKEFKKQADANYLPIKGTIPLTDKINLTTETKTSLALKYAKVSNNTVNFYIIADSSNTLPSSETRININSDITELVGAEGANVGDIFVIGKLNLLPVYKIIPLNDAKAENSLYKGTQGVVTPWDKAQINKVPNMESAISAAKNNLPTYSESNMNNALKSGFYPWCTLGRPSGSTGAYTLVTLASTTADNNGYTTIEQTAYGRQDAELGKIFKRIIFKPSSGDAEYGEWVEVTGGGSSYSNYFIVDESVDDANDAVQVGYMYPSVKKNLPDGFDTYNSALYVFGVGSSDNIQLLTDYGARVIYMRKCASGEFVGGWIRLKTDADDTQSSSTKPRIVAKRTISINSAINGINPCYYIRRGLHLRGLKPNQKYRIVVNGSIVESDSISGFWCEVEAASDGTYIIATSEDSPTCSVVQYHFDEETDYRLFHIDNITTDGDVQVINIVAEEVNTKHICSTDGNWRLINGKLTYTGFVPKTTLADKVTYDSGSFSLKQIKHRKYGFANLGLRYKHSKTQSKYLSDKSRITKYWSTQASSSNIRKISFYKRGIEISSCVAMYVGERKRNKTFQKPLIL